VGLALEVLEDHDYGPGVASEVGPALRGARNIILTGGTTASAIYERIAGVFEGASESVVYFSDERCVPADHPASNYGMVERVLLPASGGPRVERMRGEEDASREAARYHGLIAPAMSEGLDLALLGMGADCHIAGLFPGSPALEAGDTLCAAVDRPDGMRGLTLTPAPFKATRRILLLVSGSEKADAVARAVAGGESPRTCPARLLADHPGAVMLLDRAAASRL
jgi:6-phosphogluconolactonase